MNWHTTKFDMVRLESFYRCVPTFTQSAATPGAQMDTLRGAHSSGPLVAATRRLPASLPERARPSGPGPVAAGPLAMSAAVQRLLVTDSGNWPVGERAATGRSKATWGSRIGGGLANYGHFGNCRESWVGVCSKRQSPNFDLLSTETLILCPRSRKGVSGDPNHKFPDARKLQDFTRRRSRLLALGSGSCVARLAESALAQNPPEIELDVL